MSDFSGLNQYRKGKVEAKKMEASTKETSDNIIAKWKQKEEELKGLSMSHSQRTKALNERFLIDGLLPIGYHVILYGNAGSGKTSVVLKLLAEMLLDKNNADIKVFFFYVDGQLSMASKFMDYIESIKIDNRYSIVTNGTAESMLNLVEEMLEDHPHPEQLVFVLDTLKHLTPDLNNKGANAKALHRIRKIVSTGATFLSLHHTNKDGENFSGTAEVEQDSDALLKIETTDGQKNIKKYQLSKKVDECVFILKSVASLSLKAILRVLHD